MKSIYFYILISLSVFQIQIGFAQEPLEKLLKRSNTQDIPYITVQELAMPKTQYIILDSRELVEYEVSHLKNALYVGYNDFKIDTVLSEISNKNDTIVVYCSLGIRSETIAKKLKKEGYSTIYNLYGGIFEWKNNDFPVFNLKNQETDSVHAFSKMWGKWLQNGKKVYN